MLIKYKVGDVVEAITGKEFALSCPVGTKINVTIVATDGGTFVVDVYDRRYRALLNFSWSTSGNDGWFNFMGLAEPEEPSCL
jgi:hypothetical protein